MKKIKGYKLVFICKEKGGSGEMVNAESVGHSFKCPLCGIGIVYVPGTKSLGIHGRGKDTLRHELRQVTEVSG